MDRRQFLIKTGMLSVMGAASSVLAAVPEHTPGKKVAATGKLSLANELLEWRLEWKDRQLHSAGFTNKLTGKSFPIATKHELSLNFSASKHRVDIPWWNFAYGPDEGPVSPESEKGLALGYHKADFADKDWGKTDNLLLRRLHGAGKRGDGIVYPGYGWFRQRFSLPAAIQNESIILGLGAYDQIDWNDYWIFLNGVPVAQRNSSGRWREPGQFTVSPGTPAYSALRFSMDAPNLLAIRARGYDRHFGGHTEEELQHYIFPNVLSDQFVSVGEPYHTLNSLEVRGLTVEKQNKAIFDLGHPALNVAISVCYELDGPVRRKWIEVTNKSSEKLLLLDVEVDDFSVDAPMSEGGVGEPILIDDQVFCALEHPAALNQGNAGKVKLMHFPAKSLSPGESTRSSVSLLAVAHAGKATEQFLDYLQGHSPRKKKMISIFDPFGVNNQWGGCPTLDDREMLQQLDLLAQLQQKGIKFDYYVPDAGWHDHAADMTRFGMQCFPDGPEEVVEKLQSLGIAFGLWFGTSWGAESCGDNPAVWPDQTPGPGDPEQPGPPSITYRNGYPVGGGAGVDLCMAAEPYFTMFRDAVLYHMRENKVKFIKIDGGDYYCNSTHHEHLPGKYSTETMINRLFEITSSARKVDPDVFVMWYWGVRSPFFALQGDSIFESGLDMEGSATSRFPALYYRDSVNIHLDQCTQFSKFTPPLIKDSLGVWLADTRWGNYMGTERWRESLILDLGRGNLLFPQLWGDINRLTEDDQKFLADLCALVKQNEGLFMHRRDIAGDPWKNEIYGYANCKGTHGFLFLNNMHFSGRKTSIALGPSLGLEAAAGTELNVASYFPHRKVLTREDESKFKLGDSVELWLRPFEVLMLEVSTEPSSLNLPVEKLSEARASGMGSQLELQKTTQESWMAALFDEEERFKKEGKEKRILAFSARLPSLEQPSVLAIVLRLRHGKQDWLYLPTVIEITQVLARIGDDSLQLLPVPDSRQFGNTQGDGASWTVFKTRMRRAWSEQTLRFAVNAFLPADVEGEIETWVVRQWWGENELPMFEGFYGDAPG
jgi:hypothetical protein